MKPRGLSIELQLQSQSLTRWETKGSLIGYRPPGPVDTPMGRDPLGPALSPPGALPRWKGRRGHSLSGCMNNAGLVGSGGLRKIISQFKLVNERNKLTKLIFQGILV